MSHKTPAREQLARIRLLVLDFDGVLTDNRVLVDEDGGESVFCHRGDGLGLQMLRDAGVEPFVLSKERNPVVGARCRKLGIAYHQGEDHKLTKLRAVCRERGLESAEVAYVGNDVNDLECMEWVGTSVAVADAVSSVLAMARWTTAADGGRGAVREVCDELLEARREGAGDGGEG